MAKEHVAFSYANERINDAVSWREILGSEALGDRGRRRPKDFCTHVFVVVQHFKGCIGRWIAARLLLWG